MELETIHHDPECHWVGGLPGGLQPTVPSLKEEYGEGPSATSRRQTREGRKACGKFMFPHPSGAYKDCSLKKWNTNSLKTQAFARPKLYTAVVEGVGLGCGGGRHAHFSLFIMCMLWEL